MWRFIPIFITATFLTLGCTTTDSTKGTDAFQLNLLMADSTKQRLSSKISEATESGVLLNTKADWLPTFFVWENDTFNVAIRLKGNCISDLQQKTLPLRVKILDGNYWKGFEKFSLQPLASRNNLNEWVYHELLLREGILTTRLDLIAVAENEISLGIYYAEEHFSKQLLESQQRREGLIMKFDDDTMRCYEAANLSNFDSINWFEIAPVTSYTGNKLLRDTLLAEQLQLAQSLMQQFRFGITPASEIFDVELLGKYLAVLDITQAWNGFNWHSQRWYYNPVTSKLEPIGYAGYGHCNEAVTIGSITEHSFAAALLADTIVQNRYLKSLAVYSNSGYINGFLTDIKPAIAEFEASFFNIVQYDFSVLQQRADDLCALLENEVEFHSYNSPSFSVSDSILAAIVVPRQNMASGLILSPELFTINQDTIRFATGSHHIDADVIIPEGYVIVIPGGTELDLLNSAVFLSYSPIHINGKPKMPVKIYSSDGTGQGLVVISNKHSAIEHCTFEGLDALSRNGWNLTGGVTFYNADVTLLNSSFNNSNSEDALNLIKCTFSIDECVIDNTYSDGFDADFCTGTITNSLFANTANDCLDFSNSNIEVNYCDIENAGDKGISVGERSVAQLNNITINTANIGIASKDDSFAEIEAITLSNCAIGFALFQKKPEYGPSELVVRTCITEEGVEQLHLIELGSTLTLKGNKIAGNSPVNIDELYGL